MQRRALLGLLGGATSGLAGCAGSPANRPAEEPPSATASPTPVRSSIGGVDLPVPGSEIRTALPRDHIPAIVEPAFAEDWSGLEVPDTSLHDGGPLLPDEDAVIGVESDGDARAYPLRVLNWHEVVNDSFGGPLLVTYCPLCGSGVTARRTVDGRETRFGVSGKLWRNNLLMYDGRTGSLWSQLLGAAVRGPRTGERLSLAPSSFTTWVEWRGAHPETTVLLPPPHSNTVRGPDATFDYFSAKYGYDDQAQLVGFDDADDDGVLHPKALVIGVTADGEARAYPFGIVREAGVVNDRVGSLPVVVAATPGGSLVAYDRQVGATTLEFGPDGEAHMTGGGSRWERTTGRAVEGPYEGRQLESASDRSPMFWRAWADFHPETTVYGVDRVD